MDRLHTPMWLRFLSDLPYAMVGAVLGFLLGKLYIYIRDSNR